MLCMLCIQYIGKSQYPIYLFQGLLLATTWVCLFPSVKQNNDSLNSKVPCEDSALLKNCVESKTKHFKQNKSKYRFVNNINSLFFIIIHYVYLII